MGISMETDHAKHAHITCLSSCNVQHCCSHSDIIRGPFEKFMDWRQCAAVMKREVVTVMPSCSGEGIIVVA
jgi:hypothetical protein